MASKSQLMLQSKVFWMKKLILLYFYLAILIFVSGSTGDRQEEGRRCHWCGPLAEQVHRSRRAQPCSDPPNREQYTRCEGDTQYCGTVATAPPLIESRLCVKLYQDECYPVYCNTTNTWKMTCPCRGDFCNGPNTQRETEAFATLTKLITKTNNVRIKRLVQENHKDTNHTVQNHHEDANNNEIIKPGQDVKSIKTIVTNTDDKIKQVIGQILDDSKIVSNVNVTSKKLVSEIEKVKHSVDEAIPMTTHIHIKTTTILGDVQPSLSNIKQADQIPPAESLQQNTTPKTKSGLAMEAATTTTEMTTMTVTTTDAMTTTHSHTPKKSGGVKTFDKIITVISCLVSNFIITFIV